MKFWLTDQHSVAVWPFAVLGILFVCCTMNFFSVFIERGQVGGMRY